MAEVTYLEVYMAILSQEIVLMLVCLPLFSKNLYQYSLDISNKDNNCIYCLLDSQHMIVHQE